MRVIVLGAGLPGVTSAYYLRQHGHDTLGWTHACGSSASIARIVSGQRSEVDFAFIGLDT